jgi:hypothetical protein
MNIASIIWGVSLAFGGFSIAKATRQTWAIWKRTKSVNAYIVLIWVEWIVNLLISIVSWLYLWGTVPSSFAFFFCLITLWVLQTQCIVQIIINRIALLMRDQTMITRIKWGTAVTIGLINISVYCIWIPARLQTSETYVHVNNIWDRIEKGIFLVIDLVLNIYFIYLVHSKLIANGLTKYNRLFQFNVAMIFISVSLDVILIGSMSIGQGFVYVQFHPLVYFLKLHIEMNMADLIAKIVRVESGSYASGSGGPSGHTGGKTDQRGFNMTATFTAKAQAQQNSSSNDNGTGRYEGEGIHRKVETEIVHQRVDDRVDDGDNGSFTSSTAELKKQYAVV